jgi:cell fate regulator YaaT (PSP1 superfamily)
MALFIQAKFSQEEMPTLYDPGALLDLKPQDFVVVPRNGSEDVAFVAALEFKPRSALKLRRDPFPRVIRRATEKEVEAWWERKTVERKALVICKEKARELQLDIKVSHVRVDMHDNRAIFHFTSDQRVDFRALVRDLSAVLKMRIDLWQIGVRDEARMIDGFGICGVQTCCSTWLKEFRPITIRMAKDQDINLPPTKLSGQCGRLLCCLSYEVDQYREMSKAALPKGSTIKYGEDKEGVIVDRNLIANTYLVSDGQGVLTTVKAHEIHGNEARVPEQMKQFGRTFREREQELAEAQSEYSSEALSVNMDERSMSHVELPKIIASPEPEAAPQEKDKDRGRRRGKGGQPREKQAQQQQQQPRPPQQQADQAGGEKSSGRRKRKKGKKPAIDAAAVPPAQPTKSPEKSSGAEEGDAQKQGGRRKKKRRR